MSERASIVNQATASVDGPTSQSRAVRYAIFAGALILCFGKPLVQWATFCWNSELYSHCVLIPFVSAYFVWMRRHTLVLEAKSDLGAALIPAVLGALPLVWFRAFRPADKALAIEDYLALMIASLLLLLLAGALFFLGRRFLRPMLFAIVFMVFAVPFPNDVLHLATRFLQLGSADVSEALLQLSGMTYLRDGTFFALPGFKMEVAPECSGIHSTLALFISSLAAGYMLLPEWKSRTLLAVAVVPLALLRNGFRIFTIGHLCVYISPEMIHSYIHRRGGPIFFAFSLIPLFLLLLQLRRAGACRKPEPSSANP